MSSPSMRKPPFYHTATTSKSSSFHQDLPALPSSPFLPHPSHQPIDESLLPSRKKKLVSRVITVTAFLTLCSVVPVIPWAWYVFIHNHTAINWSDLQVYTTAGPTQFLLVSTVGTTVSKVFVAPVMGLYAYAAAAEWMRSSELGVQSRQPTPIHLASLLYLFQGASFSSLVNVGWDGRKRTPLAWPPILKKSLALLGWLISLVYVLTAINVWLHIDASAGTSVLRPSDFDPLEYTPQNALFARTVNVTLCAGLQDVPGFVGASCGLLDGSSNMVRAETLPSALRTMTNNSAASRAVWLDDNIAILAPSTPPLIGYQARALGVRAICRSVTKLCTTCNGTRSNSTPSDTALNCTTNPVRGPTLSCALNAGVHVDLISVADNGKDLTYDPFGPVSSTNGSEINRDFNANPIPYGDVVQSLAYRNDLLRPSKMDYFVGTTEFIATFNATARNVMYCEIGVYDVQYEFTPPETYVTFNATLANETTAGYVGHSVNVWRTAPARGFGPIEGMGQSGLATYPDIYGRHLSKLSIASVARIIQASAADKLLPDRFSGTRVTLVGMIILAIVLGLILATTSVVGVNALIAIGRTRSKFHAAARGRLISVYPLIGDSFGGLKADYETHQAAVSAAMSEEAFLQETEADRIQLVPEPVDGGPEKGMTVRLRPRRV